MFACTLGLRLGMNIDQVLDMPNPVWNLWLAFNRISPIGDVRHDLNAAYVCAATTNVHVKKGKEVAPAVFMPKFSQPVRKAERFDKQALFSTLARWAEKDKRNVSHNTDR